MSKADNIKLIILLLIFLPLCIMAVATRGDESTELILPPATPPPTGIVIDGKICDVIDGDTVEVEFTRRIRVRLRDCWAHETRTRNRREKRLGLAAKTFVMQYNGKPVRLVVVTDGDEDIGDSLTFGRIVGDLILNPATERPTDLAAEVIKAGHAYKTKDELNATL